MKEMKEMKQLRLNLEVKKWKILEQFIGPF